MHPIALHSREPAFASDNRRLHLQIDGLCELLRIWGWRVRERSQLKKYMESNAGTGDTGIFIADAQQELCKYFWQP